MAGSKFQSIQLGADVTLSDSTISAVTADPDLLNGTGAVRLCVSTYALRVRLHCLLLEFAFFSCCLHIWKSIFISKATVCFYI